MESSISGLSLSNSLNLNVNAYNTNNLKRTAQYTNQSYEDVPDYNEAEAANTSVDGNQTEKDNSNTKEFFGTVVKSGGWQGTKWIIGDIIANATEAKAQDSILGLILITVGEGLWKGVVDTSSKAISGKEVSFQTAWVASVSGATKTASSNLLKSKFAKSVSKKVSSKMVDLIKNKFPETSMTAESLSKLIEKSSFSKNIWNKNVWGEKITKITEFDDGAVSTTVSRVADSFGSIMSSAGLTLGIDYITGIASNAVKAKMSGEKVDAKSLKLGSTALRSTTKIIFQTAGQLIGGKVGKVVGTAVGATIAEFQVASFGEDEKWCGIAAGAEIAGAVACAAIYVALASNPVGWIVGAALIVGAAIGYGVTLLVAHWDDVVEWGKNTVEAIVTGIDYIGEKAEKVADKVVEAASDFVDDLETGAQVAVEFLFGWAF